MFISTVVDIAFADNNFINVTRRFELISPMANWFFLAILFYTWYICGLSLVIMTIDMFHVKKLRYENEDLFINWIFNSYYVYSDRTDNRSRSIATMYTFFSDRKLLWLYFRQFHLKHFITLIVVLFMCTFFALQLGERDRLILKAAGETPSSWFVANRFRVTKIANDYGLVDVGIHDPHIYVDVENGKMVSSKYLEEYKKKKKEKLAQKLNSLVVDTIKESE